MGLAGCSGQPSLSVTCASAQSCAAATPAPDAGLAEGAPAPLRPFTRPADPGSGGILFTASGEAAATEGVAFPPASAGAPVFVDGWSVRFTRLLVTLDDLTLSAGPNVSPGDESCTQPEVARVTGPWAVDLARAGDLPGKGGGGERAVSIAALPGGFDTSGSTGYAFGFDVVPAAAAAFNVNLDADGLVDYAQMVNEGCTVLYVGTATFNGASCTCPTPSDAAHACTDRGAGWPQLGDRVPFRFCFKSPASYLNCQNPDDGGEPLAGEEAPRGIYFQKGSSVVAQATLHADHPFWDSVLHDTPAHFDQFAARVVGQGPPGTGVTFPTVTLEMTRGVDYTQVTDAQGTHLSWRTCTPPDASIHAPFVGPMAFDAQSVPHAPGADACTGLRDLYDFSTYDQSTQGHLNSDGLCYVVRHYPSPR
jgi:hypothetical protein